MRRHAPRVVVGPEHPSRAGRDGAQQPTRGRELAQVEGGLDLCHGSPSTLPPPLRYLQPIATEGSVTLPDRDGLPDEVWRLGRGDRRGPGGGPRVRRGAARSRVLRRPGGPAAGGASRSPSALGERARGVVADLAEPGWIDEVAAATAGLEIGLAVANAAVSYVGPFLDQSPESRAATVQVNCLATTELAAWALPPMVARGRGAFIVTSSGSALAGTGAVASYSASKAYVLNLAEAIGWELRETGVVCQAVVAPAMDTPGWRSHPVDEARMLQPVAGAPSGRRGRPRPARQQGAGSWPTPGWSSWRDSIGGLASSSCRASPARSTPTATRSPSRRRRTPLAAATMASRSSASRKPTSSAASALSVTRSTYASWVGWSAASRSGVNGISCPNSEQKMLDGLPVPVRVATGRVDVGGADATDDVAISVAHQAPGVVGLDAWSGRWRRCPPAPRPAAARARRAPPRPAGRCSRGRTTR